MKLSTLYDVAKNGKVKEWSVIVKPSEDMLGDWWIIEVVHGYTDGKRQVSQEFVKEGKNLGKANETTPKEQAESQAQAMWLHQKDKGYREDVNAESEGPPLPMLAHKFSERGHNILFPAFVQRKYNGLRNLTRVVNDNITFTSRQGKKFTTLDHIRAALEPHVASMAANGVVLDGELYIHGVPFESVVSAVKKKGPLTPEVKYLVYDCHVGRANTADVGFWYRTTFVKNLIQQIAHPAIIAVPTHEVQDADEVYAYHRTFTEEGFEGTMIRNSGGAYLFKHRSTDLQKLKDFQDAEFQVVDCVTGVSGSKFDGCAIWVCATTEGKRFNVVCEGPIEKKREQFANRKEYINRKLTIRYQNLSATDGIPIFPVGLSFREDFDT